MYKPDTGQGSRFTTAIEFAIGLAEEDWEDFESDVVPPWVAELNSELTQEVEEAEVKHFETGIGRGADGLALGIEVATTTASGVTLIQAASWIFRRLRARGEHVTLSLGAAQALCTAEILRAEPDLHIDDLHSVIANEGRHPFDKVDSGHTGEDFFFFTFRNTENTRSWTYLVDSRGRVLHDGIGGPMPEWFMYWESDDEGCMPGPEDELSRFVGEQVARLEPGDHSMKQDRAELRHRAELAQVSLEAAVKRAETAELALAAVTSTIALLSEPPEEDLSSADNASTNRLERLRIWALGE